MLSYHHSCIIIVNSFQICLHYLNNVENGLCDIKTACAIVKMFYMTRTNNFQTSKP